MFIESPEEYYNLMESPNTLWAHVEATEEVWLAIIRDYPDLRRWVAGSKTIPESIIRELYICGDEDVLDQFATKRRTPPDLLRELAKHPKEWIRRTVACNAKSPREVLEILTLDANQEIRERAIKRLEGATD